tara:strand:+ start:1253 stop:1657 length:405 start_codon:yes stop_codon:yes gene_type:complete
MQYRFVIFFLFILYIYSGALKEYINEPENLYIKEIQQEIMIDQKDINVFNEKKLDDINVTEKRIKIWKIIITYNESNHNNIKSKIITSGYKVKHNVKKMYYSLGPFSDMSHAKEESNKLKNLHGLKNKIIDSSF